MMNVHRTKSSKVLPHLAFVDDTMTTGGPNVAVLARSGTKKSLKRPAETIRTRIGGVKLFTTAPTPAIPTTTESIVRQDTPPSAAPRTIRDQLGEEYLRHLRAVFHACDVNEDGLLDQNEVCILLELIGIPSHQVESILTAPIVRQASGPVDPMASLRHLMTQNQMDLESFLSCYGASFVEIASKSQLPTNEFLHRCKRLKQGFRNCDGDENYTISRTELEIAMQKLDLLLSDEELGQVFHALDRNHDKTLDWSDFVYAVWKDTLSVISPTLKEYFSIDSFEDLPSFLRPSTDMTVSLGGFGSNRSAPSASENSKQRPSHILRPSFSSGEGTANKSRIEKLGVDFLTKVSMQRVSQAKAAKLSIPNNSIVPLNGNRVSFSGGSPMARRQRSKRNGFPPDVRLRMRKIEATAIVIGSLAGILCGLLSMLFESLLPDELKDEDVTNGSAKFFLYVLLINIGVSLVEVHGMYLTAVICAFRLTVVTNLVLYPQDAEREFLTRSIARAALQVGHRKDKLFGIDPMRGSPRIVLFLSFLMYKSKRYVVKFLLKLFIKRVLWRAAAKSVLSLLVLPINGIMNAWTLRAVMLNCRVSIIGPPSAVALLEVFFIGEDAFSPAQRVDYLLVMGCCLVCKRCVHPNLEIMVDMMRKRWMNSDNWPVRGHPDCICLAPTHDGCPVHVLDDPDRLMDVLETLQRSILGTDEPSVITAAQEHRRNLFFLMIIALIIDGTLDWVERRLYIRACHAAGIEPAWPAILKLKDQFVQGKGLQANQVFEVIQQVPIVTDANGEKRQQHVRDQSATPIGESIRYLGNLLARALSC